MKNPSCLILGMIVCCAVAGGCAKDTGQAPPPSASRHSFTFETMGTVARAEIALPTRLAATTAEALIRTVFDSVNTTLSSWSADSEISRLNRAAVDSAFQVSPWLTTCLTVAGDLHRTTAGAFDPTAEPLMRLWGFYRQEGRLPAPAALDSALALLGGYRFDWAQRAVTRLRAGTRFDLGGIAKGLAVDLATDRLRRHGVGNALIDLGGNLFCLGTAAARSDWRVGIRDPLNRDQLFAVVRISNRAVATSGSYERFVEIDGKRYGHVMNPATGRPAEGLLSATVVAGSAILADGLSTALFVMGPEAGLELLDRHFSEVDAVLVVPAEDGSRAQVIATEGLRDRFEILPEYQDRYDLIFSSSLQSTQLPQSISRGGE